MIPDPSEDQQIAGNAAITLLCVGCLTGIILIALQILGINVR